MSKLQRAHVSEAKIYPNTALSRFYGQKLIPQEKDDGKNLLRTKRNLARGQKSTSKHFTSEKKT